MASRIRFIPCHAINRAVDLCATNLIPLGFLRAPEKLTSAGEAYRSTFKFSLISRFYSLSNHAFKVLNGCEMHLGVSIVKNDDAL